MLMIAPDPHHELLSVPDIQRKYEAQARELEGASDPKLKAFAQSCQRVAEFVADAIRRHEAERFQCAPNTHERL